MPDLWLPSAERVQGVRSGGTIRRPDAPSRGVVHTTETPTGTGRTVARMLEWPYHVICDPVRREVLQLIPFDLSAYALKGVPGHETNHMGICAQVCIVGYADHMHGLTMSQLDWLADEVFGPTSYLCGIPMDMFEPFVAPKDATFVMASPSSPIRLSWTEWETVHGWLGHQHAPGQDHYDPGGLDWQHIADRILTQGEVGTEPQEIPPMMRVGHDAITTPAPETVNLTGWAGRTDGKEVWLRLTVDGQEPTVDYRRNQARPDAPAELGDGNRGYDITATVPAGIVNIKLEAVSVDVPPATIFHADVDVPPVSVMIEEPGEALADALARAAAAIAEAQRLAGR